MPAPNYGAAEYLRALQALLPRGRVWPRDPDAAQTKVLSGFTPCFAALTTSANYLLVDAFPPTALELLPEWEATLGLPDPCAGESPTLAQRQAQVKARLTNTGGQSVEYFIAYAATLGYEITVTQFAPFRAGQSCAGAPVCSQDWAFAWRINAPAETITYFTAGNSAAGQPLAVWGNAVLQCELSKSKPAHTLLLFAYGQPGSLDSTFILGESALA
ncbi:YmfQ family protein [Trinickia dinghuensis]|uniref:DUF2313 domain-containing protein n=1 Tax=Trinickia dinghuensis TaxID=2291023 RepID=A0A3D8K1W2_9BURK|nr:putative phage tail protein [Trinickia dinghuensis]RDU99239.1 DUF2313 domain-containing protein [Trinickia dinghuensis]